MAYTNPFAVKLVPYKLGTSQGYRIVLKEHVTVGYEDFLGEVARESKLPLSTVRGVWDFGIDIAGNEMRSGKRVDIGFGDLYMVVNGSVEDPTENLNNNKSIRFSGVLELSRPLQSKVKAMELKNETKTINLWLHEIVEEGHTKDDENKLFEANATVVINTACGLLVPERTDEGVWLNDAQGQTVATAVVISTSPTVTTVRFPTLPEPGRYTLVYAGRNGLDPIECDVTPKTRYVTVVAGE